MSNAERTGQQLNKDWHRYCRELWLYADSEYQTADKTHNERPNDVATRDWLIFATRKRKELKSTLKGFRKELQFLLQSDYNAYRQRLAEVLNYLDEFYNPNQINYWYATGHLATIGTEKAEISFGQSSKINSLDTLLNVYALDPLLSKRLNRHLLGQASPAKPIGNQNSAETYEHVDNIRVQQQHATDTSLNKYPQIDGIGHQHVYSSSASQNTIPSFAKESFRSLGTMVKPTQTTTIDQNSQYGSAKLLLPPKELCFTSSAGTSDVVPNCQLSRSFVSDNYQQLLKKLKSEISITDPAATAQVDCFEALLTDPVLVDWESDKNSETTSLYTSKKLDEIQGLEFSHTISNTNNLQLHGPINKTLSTLSIDTTVSHHKTTDIPALNLTIGAGTLNFPKKLSKNIVDNIYQNLGPRNGGFTDYCAAIPTQGYPPGASGPSNTSFFARAWDIVNDD